MKLIELEISHPTPGAPGLAIPTRRGIGIAGEEIGFGTPTVEHYTFKRTHAPVPSAG